MRNGVQLGRVFGIKIVIDWSWFFIFVFVTWSLTVALSGLHEEWRPGLSLAVAVIAALLLFASVLAHEFAHALVALAHGLPVRNITLFMFGGVANIQKAPPSPRAEFMITIVGPIASFFLGAAFLWLGGIVGGFVAAMNTPETYVDRLGPLTTVLLWLGSVNIILAIFNLLPGFPLDGGRVLRSALWAVTGDFRRATKWATGVGQIVAGMFIIAGFAQIFGAHVPVFARGPIGGIWLILIGWFLFRAAAQSYRGVIVQDLLDGLPVAHFMRSDVPTVDPTTSIKTLVHEQLTRTDERTFPVVEDEVLVGLIPPENYSKIPPREWEHIEVQAVMIPVRHLVVTTPEHEITEALDELANHEVSQIPVLQDGRYIGVLRYRDIHRWLKLHGHRQAAA